MTTTNTQTSVSTKTVQDLYQDLLAEKEMLILDVRSPEEFDRWRIEGSDALQIINIPYQVFGEDAEEAIAKVPSAPADTAILVVCAKEHSSEFIAELLQDYDRQASYLQGGMPAWGDYYDTREVVNESFGKIVQVARPARGDLSFVIISQGKAAIVDPLRHVNYYNQVLKDNNATLTHIFDTHGHADHISGGPMLAAEHNAGYYLHPYDGIHPIDMLPAKIDYIPLSDGQTFNVGQFTVTAIWYPGHTLGQVNFLFTAPTKQKYLFTGDGIFLRSFGRPDLGGQGEAWTPILYHSMFERLPKHIDDNTMILPAHFNVLDEAKIGNGNGHNNGHFLASYGQLKQTNDALAPRDLAEFTKYVLGSLPFFPKEYVEIKRVNAGLSTPNEEEASALEIGKNICALSQ